MELPIRAASAVSSNEETSRLFTPGTETPDTEAFEKKQRWEDALEHCERELAKEDYNFIVKYKSPEELVSAIDDMITKTKHSSVPRTLRNLKPHLSQVQTFVFAVLQAIPVVETVCIWGLITLMLQGLKLAEKSEEILETIADMWMEIGNSLQIFESYKNYISEDETLGLALFETHEELLKFAVATIKILKFVRAGQYNEYKDQGKYIATCKTKFDKTSKYISHRILIIKETVQAQVLTQDRQPSPRAEIMQYLATTSEVSIPPVVDEAAKLPCHYIHLPRNPNFYGRKDILASIYKRFDKHQGKGIVPSIALWAMAGIGKTQIALEYACRQREAGLEAIFWIDTAEESEYIKAFNEIAHFLELPGASSNKDYEQNRLLVLRWLQETKTPWLLIFDNVDDHKILERIMPAYGCGIVLLTCRSELTAASSAMTTIEIPAFTTNEGSDLLLGRLDLEAATDEEKASSVELSDLLGGHALAVDVMARSIAVKKKKLPEFVRVYKEKPRAMHKKPRRKIFNQYYKGDDDLESLWAIPFGQLQPDEAVVLGILSMCGPNRLPSSALISEAREEDEVEDISLELRQLALVNIDESGTMLSTHRLIQAEFRNCLSREQRVERWYDSVELLRAVFPRQEKGSTLFNQWKECETLIEHVMALAARYRELNDEAELEYSENFAYLVSDAARYLAEVGRYNSCQQALTYGLHHCRDETSIPYTNLHTNMGSMYCERGQDKLALKHNNLVLKIREESLDPMDSEVANALSNSALSMVACGQDLNEALKMLQRSLEIDLSKPLEVHKPVVHLRYFNLGFAYRALGRLDEASSCVDKASDYTRTEFGDKSRYLTISYRMYADFALRALKYQEAFEYASRSHEIAKLSGAMTPWVASSFYYMGTIRLSQGMPKEAIEYLEQARIITQLNEREKSDAGEYARVIHKLAQAHAMAGDANKADSLNREAHAIYQGLIETGEYTRSDDEREKWDYLICIKFR